MIQELKVDFEQANGSIMTIPDYQLPDSKPGDKVILFDNDIECDGRIIGQIKRKQGNVFLILIPSELARNVT